MNRNKQGRSGYYNYKRGRGWVAARIGRGIGGEGEEVNQTAKQSTTEEVVVELEHSE